jgi:tRNA 2-selenouridine synthase
MRELARKKELVPIDVRSPAEYRDSSIPGSLNIPLFDDAERAEVGTIYTQVSSQAAKERGLELVSAKLPAFIKAFSEIREAKTVFCWRGGMRSKTTATLLSLMDIHVYRLSGGYREYRRWVVETLGKLEPPAHTYVIMGNTGVGKTAILRSLEEEGYPVVDLERMAGHRGSIFGEVGLKAHNQKTFDSLLVERLEQLKPSSWMLLEGESKRIGKIVLPDFLIRGKEAGIPLFIELPMEERVRTIMEDYRPWEHKEALLQAYRLIKERIHTPIAKEIEGLLKDNQFPAAIMMLLEHYYDPRYEHAIDQYEGEMAVIRAGTVAEALQEVKDFLRKKVW